MPRPRIVALIPALDEAATIADLVARVRAHLPDVLVIDDGSSDATAELANAAGARVIRHRETRGKGPRLVEGIERALGEGASGVLTLDGDGQHDPAIIPAFLAAHRAHPGALVLGDRSGEREKIPKGRGRSIRIGNFFIGWGCARPLSDSQCGMRLYSAEGWRRVRVPERDIRGFVFETSVLLHAAEAGVPFATVPVPVHYAEVLKRKSHFRPVGDFLAIAGAIARFLVGRGFRPRGLLIALGLLRYTDGMLAGEAER